MAILRLKWAGHPVPVELSRLQTREVSVPYVVGLLGHMNPQRLLFSIGGVEQTEIYPGGVPGEEGKVHPFAVPRSTHAGKAYPAICLVYRVACCNLS